MGGSAAHGMRPRRSGTGRVERGERASGEKRAGERISTRARTSGRGALNEASGRIGRSSCIITEKNFNNFPFFLESFLFLAKKFPHLSLFRKLQSYTQLLYITYGTKLKV
jgi:hypothetical protein